MGVLEKINQLKREGFKDDEISQKMQEQEISPREIEDAFNQLKVKKAVSADDSFTAPKQNYKMQNPPQNPGQFYTPRTKDIEETPMQQNEMPLQEDYYAPQNQENSSAQNYPASQETPQQEYYPQYNYEEYSPKATTDTDTIIEIAEQVFSDKTKTFQKQLDMLSEFATLAQNKIENNNERIKRIEKIIDNLQIKILEKVGSYGENMNSIKKEMSMMQESFSKILPELAEAKKHPHHKTEHKK